MAPVFCVLNQINIFSGFCEYSKPGAPFFHLSEHPFLPAKPNGRRGIEPFSVWAAKPSGKPIPQRASCEFKMIDIVDQHLLILLLPSNSVLRVNQTFRPLAFRNQEILSIRAGLLFNYYIT